MKDRNVGIPIGIKPSPFFGPFHDPSFQIRGKKLPGFDFDLSQGDCSLDRIATSIGDELGGGFKYVLFSPRLLGEDEPMLTSIFFKGVETTN